MTAEPPIPDSEAASWFADAFKRLREQVGRVIVGQDSVLEELMIAVAARGHAVLVGVPGLTKTLMVSSFARAMDLDFRRIQFTPDLMPADITGSEVLHSDQSSGERSFRFTKGPVFTNILLADEINRTPPKTQAALLEAMQERQVSIDGVTSTLPEPFIVMATLNPVEMEGTFPLPEAQLDRFMVRTSLGYPERGEESAMLDRFRAGEDAGQIQPVATASDVVAARMVIDLIKVNQTVREYLLDIVAGTRNSLSLRLGASPRASLALQHAAQGWAAMKGRSYVLPDDVKDLAVPVLAHRLIAETTTQLRGQATSQIVNEIVESTPVPIERE